MDCESMDQSLQGLGPAWGSAMRHPQSLIHAANQLWPCTELESKLEWESLRVLPLGIYFWHVQLGSTGVWACCFSTLILSSMCPIV